MRLTTARLVSAGTAAVLTLGLTACGGSTTSSGTTQSVPPAASSAAEAAGSAVSSAGSGASSAANSAQKVSANTASEEEITAAGVSNPGRWAEEVIEYRPYPADDPNLTKLRDNLAKYNPGQETVDKIVSALQP